MSGVAAVPLVIAANPELIPWASGLAVPVGEFYLGVHIWEGIFKSVGWGIGLEGPLEGPDQDEWEGPDPGAIDARIGGARGLTEPGVTDPTITVGPADDMTPTGELEPGSGKWVDGQDVTAGNPDPPTVGEDFWLPPEGTSIWDWTDFNPGMKLEQPWAPRNSGSDPSAGQWVGSPEAALNLGWVTNLFATWEGLGVGGAGLSMSGYGAGGGGGSGSSNWTTLVYDESSGEWVWEDGGGDLFDYEEGPTIDIPGTPSGPIDPSTKKFMVQAADGNRYMVTRMVRYA